MQIKNIILPSIMVIGSIVAYFSYIYAFGVNVLFWDEWELIKYFPDFYNGKLNLSALLTVKHNEHLMPVSFAFMLFHHLVFGVNIKLLLFSSAVIQGLSIIIVLQMARLLIPASPSRYWIAALLIISLLSLSQYTNLLWGFQAAWFLVTFFFVSMLYALNKLFLLQSDRHRFFYLLFAIGFAFLASFSVFQGLISWVAGTIFFLVKNDMHVKQFIGSKFTRVWLIAFALCVGIYVSISATNSSTGPSSNITALFILSNLITIIYIFIDVLGSVSGGVKHWITPLSGVIVLVFSLYGLFKATSSKYPSKYAFPVALIVFGMVFAVLVALGRSPLGVDAGLEPRYSTYVIIMLVGVLLIIADGVNFNSNNKKISEIMLTYGFLLFLINIYMISMYVAIVKGEQWRVEKGIASMILSEFKTEPDFKIERMLYGNPQLVKMNASFLLTRNLNVFDERSTVLPKEVIHYRQPSKDFNALITSYPDRKEALIRLWDVYCVGSDLRNAFDIYSDTFSRDLVSWASGAAGSGQHYLSVYLVDYVNDYLYIQNNFKK